MLFVAFGVQAQKAHRHQDTMRPPSAQEDTIYDSLDLENQEIYVIKSRGGDVQVRFVASKDGKKFYKWNGYAKDLPVQLSKKEYGKEKEKYKKDKRFKEKSK